MLGPTGLQRKKIERKERDLGMVLLTLLKSVYIIVVCSIHNVVFLVGFNTANG